MQTNDTPTEPPRICQDKYNFITFHFNGQKCHHIHKYMIFTFKLFLIRELISLHVFFYNL